MAKDNKERLLKLTVYVEQLQTRLAAEVPPRYKDNAEQFKFMLKTELKRTLATIEKLSLGV